MQASRKAGPRFPKGLGGAMLNAYSLVLGFLLLYPTIQLFIVAVSDDIDFPPSHFSLDAFAELAPSFWASIPFSLALGFATTILLIILSLPTVYAMERMRFRGKHLVSAAIFLPFVIPGIGYMVALGAIYLIAFPWLMGSFVGVLIPTAVFNLAFMVRAIQGSLATTDPVYEEAAQMLGASRTRAFLGITLPQIMPGILVGSMIVFANSATAFIAPLFVGRVKSITATVDIFQELQRHGLVPRLAVQALMVELVVMGIILTGYAISRKRFRGLLI
jgi:ABC-type spermidine/putrescine transport system permease subunit II